MNNRSKGRSPGKPYYDEQTTFSLRNTMKREIAEKTKKCNLFSADIIRIGVELALNTPCEALSALKKVHEDRKREIQIEERNQEFSKLLAE